MIWVLVSLFVINTFTSMLSAPSDTSFIVGYVIAVLYVVITLATGCFTNWKPVKNLFKK